MPNLDFEDFQGIIARGYGELEAGCYTLLTIRDAQAAKIWLGNLVDTVTSGAEKPMEGALNIAFTYSGLKVLGLDTKTLETFSSEFQDGMTSDYRQNILGDFGNDAPENWSWGGPHSEPVHILLMLFAPDNEARRQFCEFMSQGYDSGGVKQIGDVLNAIVLKDEASGCSKEHFGFCDAIAQPFIEGLGKTGPASNTVKAGEFILGYPNEYDLLTERPMVKPDLDPKNILPSDPSGSGNNDLGCNGSYLVFRHLQQHVNRFWQFMEDATKANGVSSPDARIRLAAKMVGRWTSGAPLVLSPDADNPARARENDFSYHAADREGLKCPLGAHIRRSNPRDSLDPHPGTEKSIAVNKRHQLLRRGRAYGEPVAASMNPEEILQKEATGERGLFFICINANISRQFEFVQQTWINNPKFSGLYNDADPLVGFRDAGQKGRTDIFTEQAEPIRKRFTGLPEFVTVRGGAYFFLPGLKAIRYLASI